ncbi:MAG TPA: DUF4184 family protein [Steroidobacteraceae bacterium]|jgi:hypothetical protein
MPFTISHAAAVLPFTRPLARWHLLSAAIIGSMVPDFHLFVPWHLERFETHSVVALFTFCLPVGLATYWLFQWHIKVPVVELLPDAAYRRWRAFERPAEFTSLRAWVLGAFGVLLGAFSHLTWDAFTHENARGVRMLPLPEDPVFQVGHHFVYLPRLLQDVSSLLGLLVVILIVAWGFRPDGRGPAERRLKPLERRLWFRAALLTTVAAIAAAAVLTEQPYPWHRPGMVVYDLAIDTLRGLAIAALLVPIPVRMRLRRLGG